MNAVNVSSGYYNTALNATNTALPITDVACGTLLAACDTGANSTTYGRIMIVYELELFYRARYTAVDNQTGTSPALADFEEVKSPSK